jgi:hypothetical protein
MGITHSKVSLEPDSADSGLVQPSDWNDDHDISTAEITNFPTSETDDTLVLSPDGAGGVGWVAPAPGATEEVNAAGRVFAYLNFR